MQQLSQTMSTVTVEWAGSGEHIGNFQIEFDTELSFLWIKSAQYCHFLKVCDSTPCDYMFFSHARKLHEVVHKLVSVHESSKSQCQPKAHNMWDPCNTFQVHFDHATKLMHPALFVNTPSPNFVADCMQRWQPSDDVLQAHKEIWRKAKNAEDILLGVSRFDRVDMALAHVRFGVLPEAFEHLQSAERDNTEVAKEAVRKNPKCIRFVSNNAKSKELLLDAASWMINLCDTPPWLHDDKDYFVKWASINIKALPNFPLKFREDPDVVLAALESTFKLDVKHLQQLDKSNDLFVSEAILRVSRLVPGEWLTNPKFMTSAVKAYPWLMALASKSVREDYDTALTAMCNHGVFQHLAVCFQTNLTIVEAALNNAFYIPNLLIRSLAHSDVDVALACVSSNGLELAFAADHLKARHDVVLAAISHDYRALKYAAPSLLCDKDFKLACFKVSLKQTLQKQLLCALQ